MITSEVCIGKYTGDGVATEFAIPFKYRLNNDLTAQIQVMTYDGTDIAYLEQGEDFEVVPYTNEEIEEKDDTGGSGGSLLGKIVFEIAPAVGLKIAILRNIPLVQRTDWVNGENVDMEAIEGEFDQLIMCLQQMQERATRTSTLSVFSDTDPQTIVETIENYATASQVAANQAVEKASEASSSATVAETSAGNAAGSASDALSAANVAESMATSASNSALASANSAGNASDSAVLAKRYAVGLPTEPAEYSAKHWAEKAAETMAEMPTKVSELENDAGYTTNIGTVTSINSVLPDSNGNVSLTVPGATWGNVNGTLSNQTDLQNALNGKYDASNPNGFITGISSSDVTTALGYTPYNSTNPAGYITSSALPTVNNSTITFTQGGVTKGSFTLNQSTGATIDFDAGGAGGIQNTATGTDSLTILGNPTQYEQAINIGAQSYAKGIYATALGGYDPEYGECQADDYGTSIGASSQGGVGSTTVGYASTDAGSGNTLVGRETFIDEYVTNSVAIGREAQVTGEGTNVTNAVQIGAGINQTSNTVQMGDYSALNLSTGLIPDARLSSNIARTSALPSITIQKVNSLPASPSSNILYCIPES